jgi:histidinol dehydrogenase
MILVDEATDAIAVANVIAPEHLQLMNADPEMLVPEVRNAGAVFCGPYAPAVIGDYVAGTNHVLPTNGTARFASALRVSSFQKHIHVVSLDRAALDRVGPYVTTLAASEGLDAHAQTIEVRRREDPS